MQQVERHIFVQNEELTELCSRAKRLYNFTLYNLRQVLFGKLERFTEYEFTGLCAEFDQPDFRALPATTGQQIVKLCFRNWVSYWKSLKEYKKSPSKFSARPKLPNYKKEQFVAVFVQGQFSIKKGHIHLCKLSGISPLKTKIKTAREIAQIRVIPQASCHVIEIIYEKQITDLGLEKSNIVALDLGISNLCTSSNNAGVKPFIINGNPLKSLNQWYNKEKSKLQSNLRGKRFSSRKINRLTHFRNCWIEDKLHKISRFIVDYCIENNIGTIVAGKNKGWKQGLNIGTKNNQHFTILPIARLLDKIRHKAELVGISYIEHEESYTSKCDSLALEPVEKHEQYLGKRKYRGLFVSSVGKLINADGNGANNVGRKVFGNDFMKNILDSRCALQHYKINVL